MKWCSLYMLVVVSVMEHDIAYALADPRKCDNHPCRNGATCQPQDAGYRWGFRCLCLAGFFGSQCQWDNLTSCNNKTKTPCVNGGRCSVTQEGRVCVCPNPAGNDRSFRFGGHYCEIVNPCSSCPENMVYCRSTPTRVTGRICLNAQHMEITPGMN